MDLLYSFFNSVIRQSFDSHVIVEFELSKVFNILSPIGGCIVQPIGLKDFSALFLIFFVLIFFREQPIGLVVFTCDPVYLFT